MNIIQPLVKGELVIYNSVDRKAFLLAEVLDVLPDYEYKIRVQIEDKEGIKFKEEIVWQRYLVNMTGFMKAVGMSRAPGL
jgi:hypothetical protein